MGNQTRTEGKQDIILQVFVFWPAGVLNVSNVSNVSNFKPYNFACVGGKGRGWGEGGHGEGRGREVAREAGEGGDGGEGRSGTGAEREGASGDLTRKHEIKSRWRCVCAETQWYGPRDDLEADPTAPAGVQ